MVELVDVFIVFFLKPKQTPLTGSQEQVYVYTYTSTGKYDFKVLFAHKVLLNAEWQKVRPEQSG